MKKIIAIIFMLLISLSIFARLFETPEECIKRYGIEEKPSEEMSHGYNVYYFQTNNFDIICKFKNNKCIAIKYTYRGDLDEKTIKLFLNLNDSGHPFKLTKSDNLYTGNEVYTNDIGTIAIYNKYSNILDMTAKTDTGIHSK